LRIMKKTRRRVPSSYNTMPYYFPTEQVDIVGKIQPRKKEKIA
jgi:hypothetical protein